MTRKMLIAGNWKMNGLIGDIAEFQLMIDTINPSQFQQHDILICPPATILSRFAGVASKTGMMVGAEDCHPAVSGAHTGDISAEMMRDAGASYCIVGHSERRANHKETDALIRSKAEAAHRAGLIAILCVGETLEQRKSGKAIQIVEDQIRQSLPNGAISKNTVIAYEPVWAIGTGETATLDDIDQMHGMIRDLLKKIGGNDLFQARILYGGSVKPANASEIFGLSDVDGGLMGGASLKSTEFCAIVSTA